MSDILSERVRDEATTLTRTGRLAFCLSCGERLFPNYVYFVRKSGWGDAAALRDALDLAWAYLEGSAVDENKLNELREQVLNAEPDTEDFEIPCVSQALDAAAVAGLILELVARDEIEHVMDIASLCRDTVDMYVQESENMDSNASDLETRILSHPLMQEELRRQHADLDELQRVEWSGSAVVRLKERWRDVGPSNIGLSA